MPIRPFLALVLVGCASASAKGPDPAAAPIPTRTGDIHDFDFIAGAWTLENHRLKARGVGSHDWDEFPARDCGTILLGGIMNVDELQFPTKGWGGVTVRTFDLKKKQWSIYWVNNKDGLLQPLVVGGFTGDRGEFYGMDTDEGRPIIARYVWTKRGPDRADWEQAFSYDGGKTWEVNWTNTLTRADPAKMCLNGSLRP